MVKSRNSKKRTLLLDTIKNQDQPISAETLFKIVKNNSDINLSTIYRSLNTLTKNNILKKHIGQDGINYYEFNDNTHKHHLICDKCHKVIKLNHCPIKEFEESISKQNDFDITEHIIEFHGICSKCK